MWFIAIYCISIFWIFLEFPTRPKASGFHEISLISEACLDLTLRSLELSVNLSERCKAAVVLTSKLGRDSKAEPPTYIHMPSTYRPLQLGDPIITLQMKLGSKSFILEKCISQPSWKKGFLSEHVGDFDAHMVTSIEVLKIYETLQMVFTLAQDSPFFVGYHVWFIYMFFIQCATKYIRSKWLISRNVWVKDSLFMTCLSILHPDLQLWTIACSLMLHSGRRSYFCKGSAEWVCRAISSERDRSTHRWQHDAA